MVASHGHVAAIEALVKHGAEVNTAAKLGMIALMLASCGGHKVVIEELVKHAAEVNTMEVGNDRGDCGECGSRRGR